MLKKKIITVILCFMLVALISVSANIGYNVYIREYKLTDTGIETSPDGKYSVTFQMVGSPEWPFGSTQVRVTVAETENDTEIIVFDDNIKDDGAILHRANWFVEWLDDSVEITLRDSEQQDKVYKIPLG